MVRSFFSFDSNLFRVLLRLYVAFISFIEVSLDIVSLSLAKYSLLCSEFFILSIKSKINVILLQLHRLLFYFQDLESSQILNLILEVKFLAGFLLILKDLIHLSLNY